MYRIYHVSQVTENNKNVLYSHMCICFQIPDTPTLGEEQLSELLDQCVRSLSQTSYSQLSYSHSRMSFADTDSRTDSVADESTVENTPRFVDKMLL
jgi:hypothetical protein